MIMAAGVEAGPLKDKINLPGMQPLWGIGMILGADAVGKRGKVVASVVPKTGMALLHRHGDDCLLHEGKPVESGIKYLLRSDVVFASG